jgi:hypothetical protein
VEGRQETKTRQHLTSTLAILIFKNSETEHYRLFVISIFACQAKSMTGKNIQSLFLSRLGGFFSFYKWLKSSRLTGLFLLSRSIQSSET